MTFWLAPFAALAALAAQDPPGKTGFPPEQGWPDTRPARLPPPTAVEIPRAEPPASEPVDELLVITAEELAASGERSLPKMIEKASHGWVQETNLGGGAPVLRGLLGPSILIVIDGVRLNDSTTRLGPNQSLNTIDPAIVDHVEILRGPASVLYGSDAVGGAILIWTKRRAAGTEDATGLPWGLRGSADAHYESATNGTRGSASLSGSSSATGWLGIGSYEVWNELHTGDGEVENTGYHAAAAFGSWERAFDEWRTLRFTARIHRDFDVPRTDRMNIGYGQTQPANELFNFHVQSSEGYTLSWADTAPAALADQWHARVFLRRYNEQRDIQTTGSTTLRQEFDDIQGYGVGLDYVKALGEHHRLTYGLDFDRDDIDSQRLDTNLGTGVVTEKAPPFAPNSHYAAAGVFVQDEIAGVGGIDLTLGARYTAAEFSFNDFTSGPAGGAEIDGDFDALTASIQAARQVSERLRLSATVAQGFRAPHLDDLAKDNTFFGGTELHNPDLDPERSLTAELAGEYAADPWGGALALYRTEIENTIGRELVDVGDPGTLGDETYLHENVGETEILGAELSLRRALGGPWAATLGGAYTWGEQDDETIDPATGEPFGEVPARRIPPLHGWIGLEYDARDETAALGWAEITFTAADDQERLHPEDLADPRINPNGTAGWGRLDFDLGGPLGGPGSASRWYAGLHNVFDREYRIHGSGVDAPGLNAVLGVSVTN
jgi:outer membrane receptor protein involved in Fe transport